MLANVLGEVIPDLKDKNVLLEKARTAPLPKYMLLTHEVIEAATWLKRYTEALSDLK
ncbi:MAG: type III-B CRISPR module-associated protein Cmr5 [Thermoplasmata archaeon]